jgi:hypothetical protein
LSNGLPEANSIQKDGEVVIGFRREEISCLQGKAKGPGRGGLLRNKIIFSALQYHTVQARGATFLGRLRHVMKLSRWACRRSTRHDFSADLLTERR